MALKHEVYKDLQQRIITNDIAAGESLNVKGLMDHYQIGRTPLREIFRELQRDGLIQRGEIKGKISSLNLRSPIKTMKVTYLDKDNQLIDKVLLLTSNTVVAKKKLDADEPRRLSLNSLKEGQEVAVVYARDERKTEALFITITKE